MNDFQKFLVVIALCVASFGATAQQVSKEQIKGLDEQVQDIKKDVLSISADLLQLEEKLLYPSNTHLSFFVSLAPGSKFRLDAVKIKIDGKDAAHHIYTFKELEALKSGGVQRVHTGNVRTGEHLVEVSLIGKTAANTDFQQAGTLKFKKAVEPKLIEIILGGPESANPTIRFKE
jgi:hypothetical protein